MLLILLPLALTLTSLGYSSAIAGEWSENLPTVRSHKDATSCQTDGRHLVRVARELEVLASIVRPPRANDLPLPSHEVTREHVARLVTFAIKATTEFASRRLSLLMLLRSIQSKYGSAIRLLVADDGDDSGLLHAEFGSNTTWLELPKGSGLSAGRNAMVQAARTPFVLIMDEDVEFTQDTSVETLLSALLQQPDVAAASGCYLDDGSHTQLNFGGPVCFANRFDVSTDGSTVGIRLVLPPAGECIRVHMAQNFLLARVEILRRHPWDPRMKVGEHETFFYALHQNDQPVLSCPQVTVRHNNAQRMFLDGYTQVSLRYQVSSFHQYFCKNFPEVRIFSADDWTLRCEERTACHTDWDAEFPRIAPKVCAPMPWDETDDRSAIFRPLIPAHWATQVCMCRLAFGWPPASLRLASVALSHHSTLWAERRPFHWLWLAVHTW